MSDEDQDHGIPIQTPPETGSGAFSREKALESHPSDGDMHAHEEGRAAFGINPADGLPQMATTPWESHLRPGLDPETLLCMEDSSAYVLRDARGVVIATFTPDEVRIGGVGGRPTVDRLDALARIAEQSPGIRSVLSFAVTALSQGRQVFVEPKRRACNHYRRQMVDFPADPKHQLVLRMCAAKRDESGEFESVRECLVLACEFRDPPDPMSTARLDAFDREKIEQARSRADRSSYVFDVSKLVQRDEQNATVIHREPDDPPDGGGGIFADR